MKFTRYEPVTVIDPCSPFYNWAGTVEKIIPNPGPGDWYTIKCTYGGLGIGPTLWLTFRPEQLEPGIPTYDRLGAGGDSPCV